MSDNVLALSVPDDVLF